MDFKTLQKGMISAMKERNKLKKDSLSILVAAVKKLAIDEGVRENIPDELVDRAVLKEIKTLKEQIETCPAERTDLKEEYSQKLAYAQEYAPKQMDKEELTAYISEKFAEVLATGNKGQIMKAVMGDLKGKADGKLINQVVSELTK